MRLRCARGVLAFRSVLTVFFATIVSVGVACGAEGGAASDCRATLDAWRNREGLEEEFFDVLWRCDSPLATERERANGELLRRFAEFEPVSRDDSRCSCLHK